MLDKCYLSLLLFTNPTSFMSKALSIYIVIIWDLFITLKHNDNNFCVYVLCCQLKCKLFEFRKWFNFLIFSTILAQYCEHSRSCMYIYIWRIILLSYIFDRAKRIMGLWSFLLSAGMLKKENVIYNKLYVPCR